MISIMALGATQRRLGGHGERTIVLRRSLVRPFVRSFVRTLHGLCRAVAAASFDGLANRARQSPPLRQPRTRFAHSNAAAAAAAVSTDNVCVCVFRHPQPAGKDLRRRQTFGPAASSDSPRGDKSLALPLAFV